MDPRFVFSPQVVKNTNPGSQLNVGVGSSGLPGTGVDFSTFGFDPNDQVTLTSGLEDQPSGSGDGQPSLQYTLIEGPHGDGYLIASNPNPSDAEFGELVGDAGASSLTLRVGGQTDLLSLGDAGHDSLLSGVVVSNEDFLDSIQSQNLRPEESLTLHAAPTEQSVILRRQDKSQLDDIDTKLISTDNIEEDVCAKRRKEETIQKPIGKVRIACLTWRISSY